MPDRIGDPWGERTPYAQGDAWPVRVDVQLAEGLDERDVDRWASSTHAMQIWRYAEQGSIELLWISATNPAVVAARAGARPLDPGAR